MLTLLAVQQSGTPTGLVRVADGGWGNNPGTYQAVGAIVTSVGIILLGLYTLYTYWSLRELRAQREAQERELTFRLRPWLGVFEFGFRSANPSIAGDEDAIIFLMKNAGALPAQRVDLRLAIFPARWNENERENPIHWSEGGAKTVFPGEDGNYTVRLSDYPQFARWRSACRDVKVEGDVAYRLGGTSYRTTSEGAFLFSLSTEGDDSAVKVPWRNCDAT